VCSVLGAAITAVEMASTRAVELTVQAMTIQLPSMAVENPGRFALSAIWRWLGYAHGVTRYLPIFSDRNSIDSFKNAVRSQIQASKAIRLQRYYTSNHPVPIDHRITGNLMDKILTTGSLERHLIRWRGNQFGRG